MKTPTYIARTEVLCCASELVATLADIPLGNVITEKARALFGVGGSDDQGAQEHWIVSDWLAEKLIEKGEIIDTDFAGLAVWARTTTGQVIESDEIILKIAEENWA